MNRNIFTNYQMPQQENAEEPDNTDSGSYPSVFDLHFSKNVRRLGKRNRSTSTLKKPTENQENPISQLSSGSESQTHPINPGAGPSFLNLHSKHSTVHKSNIPHAQSVEKLGFNSIYRNVDQCKKNFNYDPSINTPDKHGSIVNPDILASRKKYPFLVSSSQDKENIVPDNDRFKEPVQPRSMFNTKTSDQADAPLKSQGAMPTIRSNLSYPSHYIHTQADKSYKPTQNVPTAPIHEQNVLKDTSIPAKPLDLSPQDKTETNSDSSQDSTCFETAMMSTSKLVIDSPLDLSSHTAHKTMSKSHTSMEVTGTLMDMMSLVNLNTAELPSNTTAPSQQEPLPGPKPLDTPLLVQPYSLPNLNSQPLQPKVSEVSSHTPAKPICEPVSKSQSKNESTPIFKRPLSVNNHKQSNSSGPQEQSQKCTDNPVAKSNVMVPSTSILKKSSEENKDIISLNNKHYQVLGLLGKGGSSSVYVVQENQVSEFKPLALKVVNLSTIPDQSTADGYVKEVQYLDKLRGCPCVITMYDYEYDTASKHLYVLMEKGDSDLSKYLRNINKMITIPNTMIIIIKHWYEMLLAVKTIHAEGIIHSDLKPANFLFVGGVLKIIDFGIASSLQGDQTSVYKETASGTLNYMSPESIGHSSCTSRITYKSDVWSLGCILYNMIYGKTPYSHIPNAWAKMQAIASPKTQVEFKTHLDNKIAIPPTLLQSMKLCLQKDPKARPTVVDLLSIIESRLSSF